MKNTLFLKKKWRKNPLFHCVFCDFSRFLRNRKKFTSTNFLGIFKGGACKYMGRSWADHGRSWADHGQIMGDAGLWWVFAAYGWVLVGFRSLRLGFQISMLGFSTLRLGFQIAKWQSKLAFTPWKSNKSYRKYSIVWRSVQKFAPAIFLFSQEKCKKFCTCIFFFEIWISQKFRKSWPPHAIKFLMKK